jgi:hypothetical protein
MFSSADRALARRCVISLALVAVTLGGCAQEAPQQQPSRPPLVVDAAMQRREWERSVAPIPNGDTVSGYNRFPLRTDLQPGDNEYGAAAYDIVASLAQTVALPFTYLFIPPFSKAVYHGDVVGPTYTGMPEMRPPVRTVNVDGLIVDRDTLEVRGRPKQQQDERYHRYGPQGPGDSEVNSTEAGPAEQFD